MATIRSRVETIARCVVALTLAVASAWTSQAATISPSEIKVEIATNLVWLENSGDSVVTALDGQQNFFDRLVTEATPLLRITNLSTDFRFLGGQLGLENSFASIVDIQFLDAPGQTAWFWDTSDESNTLNHAHFQLINPLMPGQTVSMRFVTAQREDGYTMYQNLFCGGPEGGTLRIGTQQSLSTEEVQFDPLTHKPIGLSTPVQGIEYDLSTIPIVDSNSGVSRYAVEITVAPVPEPTGVMLAGAALASLAVCRGWARRRRGGLGKA